MSELPDWAQRLDLSPHPEGGWFRETWRSGLTIPQSALPPDYAGSRSAGTAILFLLMPGQQSAWHTVRSTELWLYHRGSPLLLQFGAEQASAATHLLGSDITAGEQPQLAVPAGPLAAGPPARRRALAGQLRRGARIRLRRLRAGRSYRLSSCTAADTSAALSGAVEPSGSSRVSSMPMRACTPRTRGVFEQRPTAFVEAVQQHRCRRARREHLAEHVVGGGDIAVGAQFDHHPHAVRGDLRARPRRRRLGVEDADLDAEPLAQQQPGEVAPTRARASSPTRSREARSTLRLRAAARRGRVAPRSRSSPRAAGRERRAAPHATAASTISGCSESTPSAVLGCMCTALAPAPCAATASAASCSGVTGRFGC